MKSLIAKHFDAAKTGKPVPLFKSHRSDIADDEQKRDFIYVDDAVAVMRWLFGNAGCIRHFQRGDESGPQLPRSDIGHVLRARPSSGHPIRRDASRHSEALSVFYTRIENLRRAGYNGGFTPLEQAVDRYVNSYLNQPDQFR
jgi:ADP-L-glycero-D-manno-heptose 6-epimerase